MGDQEIMSGLTPSSYWNTTESDNSGIFSSIGSIIIIIIGVIVGTLLTSVVGGMKPTNRYTSIFSNNQQQSLPKKPDAEFDLKNQPEKGTTTWYNKKNKQIHTTYIK
jgi:hypothetical protein